MVNKNRPIRDSRHPEKYFPFVSFFRRPTSTDIRHPKTGVIYSRPYFWRVDLKPNGSAPDSGNEGELWYLEKIVANVATWQLLDVATGTPILTITGDSGGAVPGDTGGDMDLNGLVVANATRAKPVFFTGTPGSFKQELEVQVAVARTGAPGDKNDAGLCSFDDTAFAVDADGYVTLAGGAGPAVDSVNVDANTGPGTDPVVPTAAGQITVAGAAVAAHSVPIETHSRAANTYNIEVQYANGEASTTAASSGICHFDSGAFGVDANGFVTLAGGGTAAISYPVDANTGPGTDPVVPNASGEVTISGAAVAAHTVPVEIHSRAANAYNVEVQVADAITGAPGDKDDAGICSFDDTKFTVDTDGYVSLASGIGAGCLVCLAVATASTSSELTFTSSIDSTYDQYLFVFDELVPSTTFFFDMQTSTDGGSTYDSTAGDYKYSGMSVSTTGVSNNSSTSSTYIRVSGLQVGGVAGNCLNGWMQMSAPSSAATFTHFNFWGSYTGPTASPVLYNHFSGGGCRYTAADVDAIRFFPSTGTITSGSIRLYGIKNS